MSSKDWTSWAILTGGVLIAAVLQGLILIITGGTELIKLEVEAKTSELTKAMKNLEVANAAKSTFTSTMSHEIRTPLNGVIGLLNQCLKTELTDKQHFYLTQAKLSSDTLLSLVNLVLDFSKIESGKLELEEAEFNLSHILKKIQAIFTELAGQKDIGFDLVLPEIIPETLIGDALRIEQILLNLCGNAVKFTEQGGVTLQLAVEEETESEVNIIIIVTDSGIGIAKGKIANLFNSYQQADSSTSRKFGGTGLGLTITRRLVELMDGKLSVSSQIGEGTQFTFQLKLRKTSECHHLHFDSLSETVLHSDSIIQQEENVKRQKSRRVNNHRRELSGCAILVVEDVAVNQLIAKEILQENGAVVTLADNGDMAIKELQTGEFDLVLMDIQMPIKDGYETTKLIRRLPKYEKLPIIAMTANVMSTDVQQAKDAGMNDHIAKPIDEKVMVAKIKSYLKADQSTKT